jgi:hypothetical protein
MTRPTSDGSSDGETLVFQTMMIVAPGVWRFGAFEGTYYVRVFRSSTYAKAVVLLADTGNEPEVSVANRIDEICSILAEAVFQLPGVRGAQLDAVASWVTVMPAGLFGPSFGEKFDQVTFEGGRPRNRYLRHAEVEELVGDQVRQLAAADCTPAALDARGVGTMRVDYG